MEIKHLSFSYGNHNVIKDFSVKFPKGKITTLLGSNGCGKSTLFKLCTRELSPKRGIIKLDGRNIRNIQRLEFAKEVSIVHQKNRIRSDITVEELVSYGRNPYIKFLARPSQEDYEKIDDALRLCHLEELKDKNVNSLSGGQFQRVWIAMAIAQDTEVVFLDEPTTYLDIKYQIEILDLVKELNRKLGKTIIMVLHDINQSIEYSDYIVGMYRGNILFQGGVDVINDENISEIYDTPLVVRDFDNRKIVMASKV